MQLVARSTALVLIDLQKGVLGRTTAPHSTADVYQRSLRLAGRFRVVGAGVVAPY
jgi:hypothetical protein